MSIMTVSNGCVFVISLVCIVSYHEHFQSAQIINLGTVFEKIYK